jgi:hypothetical protein
MARQVIRQDVTELTEVGVHPPGRIRRPGGGRKKAVSQDPSLLRDLEGLVEPVTRGDPESPLRWTFKFKSLRKLAEELRPMGHLNIAITFRRGATQGVVVLFVF